MGAAVCAVAGCGRHTPQGICARCWYGTSEGERVMIRMAYESPLWPKEGEGAVTHVMEVQGALKATGRRIYERWVSGKWAPGRKFYG